MKRFLESPHNQLLVLLLLIFWGLIWVIPQATKHHGDEAFYTDAAIRMTQTGDYWTPYYADGSLRFLKPIVTYWAIAGGYAVFGINCFASRFLFLVAGCLVVLLTYRLARVMFPNASQPALAALVIGTNIQMLTVSLRSTPDVLVCLFTVLSLLGFARILIGGNRSFASYLMAYAGIGLAVQTKGLLGLCPLGYVALFAGLRRDRADSLRQLWNGKAVSIGLSLALFWYAAMIALHGPQVIRDFFADQMGAKVSFDPLVLLKNPAAYLIAIFRHFLPWTLLLAVGLMANRGALAGWWRNHRLAILFLGGWAVTTALVFSFSNMTRTRYLVVCYPMLAVLLAAALEGLFADDRSERWLRVVSQIGAGILGIAGLVLGVMGGRISARIAVGGGVVLALAVAIGWVMQRRARWAYWLVWAAVPLGVFLVAELLLRPMADSSPVPALAARLKQMNPPPATVHTWKQPNGLEGLLRVFTGGLAVKPIKDGDQAAAAGVSPVVFNGERPRWLGTNYVVEPAGFDLRRWRAGDYLELLRQPRSSNLWERVRIPYFVAVLPAPDGGQKEP